MAGDITKRMIITCLIIVAIEKNRKFEALIRTVIRGQITKTVITYVRTLLSKLVIKLSLIILVASKALCSYIFYYVELFTNTLPWKIVLVAIATTYMKENGYD